MTQLQAAMDAGPTWERADVVLIGASISALMAACHLRLKMPDLDVLVIGPRPADERRPIVGESTVEPSALFFRRLGLGDYLEAEHTTKNGLSYYHKLAPSDPADRRYSVHAPEMLVHLARQLDRPRFDEDLRAHAEKLGARFLDARVEDIAPGSAGASHTIAATQDGQEVAIVCRWVIDCSGRQRVLGRKVTTYIQPKERQRSCFWFRLADFEPFHDGIEMSRRRPWKYDIWETTHHFLGRGNWIWGIPLKSKTHGRLISVGITYRPDIVTRPIRTLDDFLDHVGGEHPAIAEMVRSGTVVDRQVYLNYVYFAEQVYSPDGWFLIGDAAHAVDPLYSTGITLTVIQVEQIAEMIARARSGTLAAKTVADFERLWMTVRSQNADEAGEYYEVMDDPFQACMQRYWSVMSYFNALLPMWQCGAFHDPAVAPVLARMFAAGRPMTMAAKRLIASAATVLGPDLNQADFDRSVDFDWVLNTHFDCPREEAPRHFARLFAKRAQFRLNLMRMAGLRAGARQLPLVALELALSRLMPAILKRRTGGAFGPAAGEDRPAQRAEGETAMVA